MGRTNKLVDGCYSFWQGGIFPLLQQLMPEYLAQCSILRMPVSSSSSATADAGSSQTEASSGDAGLAVAGEEVLSLEGKDPVVQALDDLHRTKVLDLKISCGYPQTLGLPDTTGKVLPVVCPTAGCAGLMKGLPATHCKHLLGAVNVS